jgi:hypothetical protein
LLGLTLVMKILVRARELVLEDIPGIAEGMNQKLIKIELEVFLERTPASKKGKKDPSAAGEPAAAER